MGSSGVTFFALLFLLWAAACCRAQLSTNFYEQSCPAALLTIRRAVRDAIAQERRMAASLIRVHFQDCFVQGCDASILLDDSATIVSEQNALQNFKSIRGLDVIDAVKSTVEQVCPGVVSCADIIAVAARDASDYVGGPTWDVKLGRRDSLTANKDLATANIPLGTDGLEALIASFARQGLSAQEMVALAGAHTIGQAQCIIYRGRIYNATNINPGFATTRRRGCPATIGQGDGNLAPLDLVTPDSFDNSYFKDLMCGKGLLTSDQALYSGSGGYTDSMVSAYSRNTDAFYSDFASAMIKMGDIAPLTGNDGQIRNTCGAVN